MKRSANFLLCSIVFFIASLCYLGYSLHKRFEITPFPYISNARPMSEEAFMAWVCSDHLNTCAPGVKVMEVRNNYDLEMCVHESAPRQCIFTVGGNYEVNSRIPLAKIGLDLAPTRLEDCDRALFQCFNPIVNTYNAHP